MRSARIAAMLAIPVVLLAAGCGGGSSGGDTSTPPSGSGGEVIDIPISDSGFSFTKSSVTASAGTITLSSVNPQSSTHDISIKGNGIDEQGNQVSGGDTSTVTVTLKAGTYEYYCSVPGHEDAGMKGTLTVS
jgi:plastocyanin